MIPAVGHGGGPGEGVAGSIAWLFLGGLPLPLPNEDGVMFEGAAAFSFYLEVGIGGDGGDEDFETARYVGFECKGDVEVEARDVVGGDEEWSSFCAEGGGDEPEAEGVGVDAAAWEGAIPDGGEETLVGLLSVIQHRTSLV